jgi:hypothetical protein
VAIGGLVDDRLAYARGFQHIGAVESIVAKWTQPMTVSQINVPGQCSHGLVRPMRGWNLLGVLVVPVWNAGAIDIETSGFGQQLVGEPAGTWRRRGMRWWVRADEAAGHRTHHQTALVTPTPAATSVAGGGEGRGTTTGHRARRRSSPTAAATRRSTAVGSAEGQPRPGRR